MSRARYGLTGLALLFLLVLSAAALFSPVGDGERAPQVVEDPLATLGVAPGNTETPPEAPTAPPPDLRSAPLTVPDGDELDDLDTIPDPTTAPAAKQDALTEI